MGNICLFVDASRIRRILAIPPITRNARQLICNASRSSDRTSCRTYCRAVFWQSVCLCPSNVCRKGCALRSWSDAFRLGRDRDNHHVRGKWYIASLGSGEAGKARERQMNLTFLEPCLRVHCQMTSGLMHKNRFRKAMHKSRCCACLSAKCRSTRYGIEGGNTVDDPLSDILTNHEPITVRKIDYSGWQCSGIGTDATLSDDISNHYNGNGGLHVAGRVRFRVNLSRQELGGSVGI